MNRKALIPLLGSQTLVAFNDNASKLAFAVLAPMVMPADKAPIVVSMLAALLVLPFVLFAPLVGWLSDRYSKQRVLHAALILQIVVMAVLWLSLARHSMIGVVFGFGLLAIQSSIYSPAKQGILKELVGSSKLGVAVGWMEMLTIGGILGGSVVGGTLFDWGAQNWGDPWKGAMGVAGILTIASVISWALILPVPSTPAQSQAPFRASLFWEHFSQIRELWRDRPLWLAALGNSYFFSLGGVLYLTVLQFGRELYPDSLGAGTDASRMLLSLGVGVGAGSLAAAAACHKRIELGMVPIGGLGLSLGMLLMGLLSPTDVPFYMGLMLLGFFGGLFTIPLMAFLQDRAGDERRGRVIATANLLTNIGGIAAVGLQYVMSQVFHWNASTQCLILVIPSTLVAFYVMWLLPDSLMRFSILFLTRFIYRIRTKGVEKLPTEGGVLLISNHVSYVDAIILQAACPRPIRYVAYEGFHKKWWLGWALRIFGVIPISARHAKDAIRATAESLKKGEVVCIFPEGELTRSGTLLGLRKGFEIIARQAGVPVMPVFMDALWGSIFSFAGGKYFWKIPRGLPYSVFVDFGNPMPPQTLNTAKARQEFLDRGEEAFQERPELKGNLGYACLKGLARQPWEEALVDVYPKRRVMSRGMLLSAALALASRLKESIPEKRVGIVLPPGLGGTLANLAVVLMGKVPVNLNFTAGRSALESCLRRAEIKTVISADAVKTRFQDFPWPEKTLDLPKEIGACGKAAVIKWFTMVWTLPVAVLAKMIGLKDEGDHEEAGLLFTSGSSGEPKGVVLSHRNILGNCAQISSIGLITPDDKLLACLPLFHSFGFTVTLWYPIIRGVRVVTVPSPLEVKKISEAIKEERATIFLGTPTFLRPYLRKVEPEFLKSLRVVIAGAEKLPKDLHEEFLKKFNVPIMEGYGLTETAPVTSVNLPDPEVTTATASEQPAHRQGSVGRLIPGMTARIVDPETGAERSLFETGMLHLKGPNIFEGYLGEPERTAQVLKNGWFVTGDLARFDEDGFLYIEGRLSRFSKVGGEMVPHGTVEQKLIELLGLAGAEAQPLAVAGIPDESKGEALVLLSTVELAGLPNLWIPRIIVRVEKIPTLASGKLDLKGIEKLARESQVLR
jgi:acyl-[acyl-carrier-protein]-phospholipid O-acyltransferase / long-chain-fatty-acid--[acyl-carrier-protein] ligase